MWQKKLSLQKLSLCSPKPMAKLRLTLQCRTWPQWTPSFCFCQLFPYAFVQTCIQTILQSWKTKQDLKQLKISLQSLSEALIDLLGQKMPCTKYMFGPSWGNSLSWGPWAKKCWILSIGFSFIETNTMDSGQGHRLSVEKGCIVALAARKWMTGWAFAQALLTLRVCWPLLSLLDFSVLLGVPRPSLRCRGLRFWQLPLLLQPALPKPPLCRSPWLLQKSPSNLSAL